MARPLRIDIADGVFLFLLGATALENFGGEVDPVHKRLEPIPAVTGGFLAST